MLATKINKSIMTNYNYSVILDDCKKLSKNIDIDHLNITYMIQTMMKYNKI